MAEKLPDRLEVFLAGRSPMGVAIIAKRDFGAQKGNDKTLSKPRIANTTRKSAGIRHKFHWMLMSLRELWSSDCTKERTQPDANLNGGKTNVQEFSFAYSRSRDGGGKTVARRDYKNFGRMDLRAAQF